MLLKNAQDKFITTWWMVFNGGIFALIALLFIGPPERNVWWMVICSVLVEAVYFVALSRAYQNNDFSLVYPIARGAAPAFLVTWSILFLHEKLTMVGLLGLTLIVIGLVVIGSSNLLQTRVSNVPAHGILSALFVALLISMYSLIDGVAVKQTEPLSYIFSVFCLAPVPLAPFVWKQYGWEGIKRSWLGFRIILPAILGLVAYLLAVLAFKIAPLGYSGAVREVSVVFGALAGWRLFGEKMGGVRVLGAIIIFTGILIITIFG
jgi:drug/metabolite transporter (DMT)-like permease